MRDKVYETMPLSGYGITSVPYCVLEVQESLVLSQQALPRLREKSVLDPVCYPRMIFSPPDVKPLESIPLLSSEFSTIIPGRVEVLSMTIEPTTDKATGTLRPVPPWFFNKNWDHGRTASGTIYIGAGVSTPLRRPDTSNR
jgi:hypothetical protein